MADPISLIPEIIKLTAKVARNLTEYRRNVKDAPVLIRNITLEVNTLKGVLETLQMTLEDGRESAHKAGLMDSLNSCQGTLNELQLLVIPEEELEDSECPRFKIQRRNQSQLASARHGRGDIFGSPHSRPYGGVGINRSLLHAQASTEHHSHNYGSIPEVHVFDVDRNAPDVPSSTPNRRRPLSLSERLKWPLFQQRKAEELLKQLERHKTQLSLAIQADTAMNLTTIIHSVQDIEATLNDGEKRAVLAWLKPKIDMYEFHFEQHDKQEDETCEWITESRGWKQWLNGGSSEPGGYRRFVWIYGIPGAGKTVLASFLIDNIAKHCQATGYSYYYCHNERNQDETLSFLRWIVADLSRQVERFIPKELEALSCTQNFTIEGLLNCFSAISRQFRQQKRRVYLVVDAVDESKKPRRRLLDVLTTIGTDPAFEHVSLLMTSRDEQDIRDAMEATEAAARASYRASTRNWDNNSESLAPYTSITMSNADVMEAIRTYVKKQFARNIRFKLWPAEFREKVEDELARNARGMFRWVACQIDILERIYMDRDKVTEALSNLPETLFDTYARILGSIPPEERAFARTGLALICSNTSKIKSADVLVQASLHNVQHGLIHVYNVRILKDALGCLIKVTDLRKKPASIFRHEDDDSPLQKVTIAHYTVREFLFEKSKKEGEPRPAGDFALSDNEIRLLELQVVFNGLQQWGRNRLQNTRNPTRYEEHCLEMTDSALRGNRQALIVRNHSIWESVVPCLALTSPHLKALTNQGLRKRFSRWARLCAIEEVSSGTQPRRDTRYRKETGILASLILLEWPEFARKYLKDTNFQTLPPETKHAIWTDEFTLDPPSDVALSRPFTKGEPVTLLRLCVLWKLVGFLEIFIDAGAKFTNEPDIIFTALQHPYDSNATGDDGSTTGQLLKVLLERGADPDPPGFKYTPLQDAVNNLEESWVQSLLVESRDANSVGNVNGRYPPGSDSKPKPWHKLHPLEICRRTKPSWLMGEDSEEQIDKARRQVELLLIQYGGKIPPTYISIDP